MSNNEQKGFTLLEVLIVVGLIAAIVTIVMTRMDNRNTELRETIRRIGVLSRNIQSMARLQGATYRLVIDMQSGPDSEYKHKFWVEKSNRQILLTGETKIDEYIDPEDEDKKKKEDSKEAQDPNAFSVASNILKSPEELTRGLIFEDVEFTTSNTPVTSGRVYIHFLPQGSVEESAIHLAVDDKMRWTIAIHPLTGRSDIMTKYVSLKELRDQ